MTAITTDIVVPLTAIMTQTVTPYALTRSIVQTIDLTDVVGVQLYAQGKDSLTFQYSIDGGAYVQMPMNVESGMLKPVSSLRLVCDGNVNSIVTSYKRKDTIAGDFPGAVSTTPGSTAPTTVQLTGDYTLLPTDDGNIFLGQAGSAITVTVPVGLAWVTGCVFKPANTGSITMHPTGGVLINGSASDLAINIATNPVPAALVATGVTNNYGVTIPTVSFGSLTGLATDNSDLSTRLASLFPLPPGGAKLSAAYTLANTDKGATIWLAAQAADKIISVPNTLDTNFWCIIAYLNSSAAAGRMKVQSSGGSTLNGTLNIATGALQQGPFWFGTASANNIAAAIITSEGATPGGTFLVLPICGVIASS